MISGPMVRVQPASKPSTTSEKRVYTNVPTHDMSRLDSFQSLTRFHSVVTIHWVCGLSGGRMTYQSVASNGLRSIEETVDLGKACQLTETTYMRIQYSLGVTGSS